MGDLNACIERGTKISLEYGKNQNFAVKGQIGIIWNLFFYWKNSPVFFFKMIYDMTNLVFLNRKNKLKFKAEKMPCFTR